MTRASGSPSGAPLLGGWTEIGTCPHGPVYTRHDGVTVVVRHGRRRGRLDVAPYMTITTADDGTAPLAFNADFTPAVTAEVERLCLAAH